MCRVLGKGSSWGKGRLRFSAYTRLFVFTPGGAGSSVCAAAASPSVDLDPPFPYVHLRPTDFLSLSVFPFLPPLIPAVLTPPESEKADSEDRVSLKVCSSSLLSKRSTLPTSSSSYFGLGKTEPLTDLLLHVPDPKAGRSSRHPYLCGSLQVSASGKKRPGAQVSHSTFFFF